MISVTGALQAKIDLHKAGKLARRLNAEMKRYQAAVDAGARTVSRLISSAARRSTSTVIPKRMASRIWTRPSSA